MSHQTLNKTLKLADSFGVTSNFRLNKREKFQTSLGGGVTIFYIISSIAYFIYNFHIFYSKQKMTLNYTEKIFDDAPFINFTDRETAFGVGLYFENNSEINMETTGQFFEIDFSVVSVINTHNKYKLPIKFGFCNESDFFDSINEEFKWLNMNRIYCPKNKTLMFSQGTNLDELWQFVEITVRLKEETIISGQDDLKIMLTKHPLKVFLYFLDTYLDVDHYEKPIKPYLNSFFLYIDADYFKKVNIDFMTLDFSSDENPFLSNPILYKHIIFDSSREYGFAIPDRINSGSPDYENLVRFYIRTSIKSKFILRSYQKFSEYLSTTTVLISNSYLILFVVMRFINEDRKSVV